MLGIGLLTRNHLSGLQECLAGVSAHLTHPAQLLVADDGSTDGTQAWLSAQQIPCLTGRASGSAWNRNRALYYFVKYTDCDPIVLLDEGVRVWEPGWEQDWIQAVGRWQIVHWGGQEGAAVSGDGTPESPFRARWCYPHCTFLAREAVKRLGFYDTRFAGSGYEQMDYAGRAARLYAEAWGAPAQTFPCLVAHVGVAFPAGALDAVPLDANRRLCQEIASDPIWRPMARTAAEAAQMRAEVAPLLVQEVALVG